MCTISIPFISRRKKGRARTLFCRVPTRQIGVGYQHKTVVRQRTAEPESNGQRVIDMSVARLKEKRHRSREREREADGGSESDDGGDGGKTKSSKSGRRKKSEKRKKGREGDKRSSKKQKKVFWDCVLGKSVPKRCA